MKKIKAKLKLKLKIPEILCKQEEEIKLEDSRQIISRIIDNLYISGCTVANDIEYLKSKNFTHIINCSSRSSSHKTNSQFKCLSLCLKDDPQHDIISPLISTIKFLESETERKKKILFHCTAGVSRGPALMAGYLMYKYNLYKDEAVAIVMCKRPCTDINFGFLVQLNKWELFLRGSQNEDEITLFKISESIVTIDEKEIPLCDNCDDIILARFKNCFVFVRGIYNSNNYVDAVKLKSQDFFDEITCICVNYYKGLNRTSRFRFPVVNYKEFQQKNSFFNHIKKSVGL